MPVNSLPAEWLRGTLSLCVLGLLSEGDSYGYAITERLEEAGLGVIKGGTLYPLLARLESQQLVEPVWRSGQGPDRKYLHLTDAGRSELTDLRSRWKRFASTVDSLAHGRTKDDHGG
ncbi:PadR family transcriptional regulator [Actinoplanes sp. SE50]|uniref:PadR family transcriptional regulator n=1 Tax=unclassified Actinoplanes TaxID=2626549 RepID=UPI00023ED4FC|nr:PadR family transcriptional regulator, regulatory protein PadR [Actinoplanes sp. SE50/110]ATO86269.1 PadR family transcriptional regulator [Actinoplanes sp. SE50]SLM03684.1 PadR family transcriptional regulator [Actinoplanes sp. SE50/110]